MERKVSMPGAEESMDVDDDNILYDDLSGQDPLSDTALAKMTQKNLGGDARAVERLKRLVSKLTTEHLSELQAHSCITYKAMGASSPEEVVGKVMMVLMKSDGELDVAEWGVSALQERVHSIVGALIPTHGRIQ